MTEEFKIDINQADVETLTQLTGVGDNLAKRIIEYRETVHPFEEVIELAAVPGISERLVRTFADEVTVGAMAAQPEPPEPEQEEPTEDAESPVADAVWTRSFFEEEAVEETETAETAVPESMIENTETEEATDIEAIVEEPSEELPIEEIEEIEEIMEPEPEPATEPESAPVVVERVADPPPPVSPPPTVKQKRPLGLILLGSILGAFIGVVLTLAILAVLNNGTLQFAQADTRLRNELNDTRQTQDDLSQALDGFNSTLSGDMEAVVIQAENLAQRQQEVDRSLAEAQQALDITNKNVAALEEITAELDERLTTVAAAAENFDAFLDGLRNLLVDFQGMPVPTMTPYITPDKWTATPSPSPEATQPSEVDTAVTPEASSTVRATRTPRPSATPIALPTSTPGQQP